MSITLSAIEAFSDNYIWALVSPNKQTAVVVDPGDETPVIAFLEENQLSLAAILLTHHHPDHSGGIDALASKYQSDNNPVPVYGPKYDTSHRLYPLITHPVSEGDQITIAAIETTYEVLEIPGHTLDHIAFYGNGHLFCGDTLFSAGCGRLFEGTPANMLHSLNKLKTLPPKTKICAGHEYTLSNLKFAKTVEPDNQDILSYLDKAEEMREKNQPTLPSTLETELKINPFLRTDNDDVKQFEIIRGAKDVF